MTELRPPLDLNKPLGRVAVFTQGLARLEQLGAFVRAEQVVYRPRAAQSSSIDAVVGWGHKRTANRARAYAERQRLPYLALEDGFLRSVRLGSQDPPLSIVVDDVGIYYDATQPSRLENLLEGRPTDVLGDPELLGRARRCRERITEAEISKYNHTRPSLDSELQGEEFVLVVDQTQGDTSVQLGLGSQKTFDRMLEAAVAEHPGSRVVVKVHPETVAGRRFGYLAQRSLPPGVEMLSVAVNPMTLLKRACHVYVCTSQLGFDALLVGKPVTCFGAPFYAGWGLTDDRTAVSRRSRRRSIEELVAAALLVYPRYVHPVTGQPCSAEVVVEHLALQRRRFIDHDRPFLCFGFSWWKRPFVRRYLSVPGNCVTFVGSPESLQSSARAAQPRKPTVVVWASRSNPEVEQTTMRRGLPLWRMEDGFLRSVGLGSDLTAPGSLVLDQRGIHYDPSLPSDLEILLQQGEFTAEDIQRARRLRERIIESGVSKYNSYEVDALELGAKPGQRVVLVPGQVADDASVLRGSPRVRDDARLLEAVRDLRPDAYLVYKPHPDVLSRNRRGRVPDRRAGLWDQLVGRVSIAACLAVADEVHTMTSLVGFEALLRGLPVVTHGLPFYAGWGLTEDRLPIPRRSRRLGLDELVAGTLLRYPLYYSWRAHAFCTAEDMVEELVLGRSARKTWLQRMPRVFRGLGSLAVAARELTRDT